MYIHAVDVKNKDIIEVPIHYLDFATKVFMVMTIVVRTTSFFTRQVNKDQKDVLVNFPGCFNMNTNQMSLPRH